MTTLKEYKAMMEGVTDAPWVASKATYPDNTGGYDWAITVDGQIIAEAFRHTGWADKISGKYIEQPVGENAKFIAASRNLAPELIRVIELAEEALNDVYGFILPHEMAYQELSLVDEALSEIRKLRGE